MMSSTEPEEEQKGEEGARERSQAGVRKTDLWAVKKGMKKRGEIEARRLTRLGYT